MRAVRLAEAWAFALAVACCLYASPLCAGQARLGETAGPDRVAVETSDASVDEVLAVLAAHFDFAVERGAPSDQTVRFSGRLEGSLDRLLERLLRHEGHVIVRSPGARGGISRVVLLEGKSGAPPVPVVTSPMAAIKARLGLRDDSPTRR
jgi:hypothetical protein